MSKFYQEMTKEKQEKSQKYHQKLIKIVVKGVNVRKKHVKARKQGEESGIIAVECAIPSSKVNVVCPKCGKTTKIGYSIEKDKKERICKKCGAKLKQKKGGLTKNGKIKRTI